MSDDFPSVERGSSSTRTTRAKKPRAKKAKKVSAKKQSAADRKALREAGEEIAGDTSDAPKREKSYLDKIADKVTNDLFKKTNGKRKPSARQRRENADNASDLAKTLMGIGNTPVGQLAKKGGALAVGGTAALALLAGLGSYYATTYIIDRLAAAKEARTPAAVRFEAAMAYRQARIEAARKLGRDLSPSEQSYLGSQFKAKLATIGG